MTYVDQNSIKVTRSYHINEEKEVNSFFEGWTWEEQIGHFIKNGSDVVMGESFREGGGLMPISEEEAMGHGGMDEISAALYELFVLDSAKGLLASAAAISLATLF